MDLSDRPRPARPVDDRPHPSGIDEWVFAAWTPDGTTGLVSGHRITGRRAWYWFALVESGRPMLHLTEWDVALRSDPFVVKAPEMWAEHHCVSPFEQWTIGNEGHAAALDDPEEAFGRAYGVPTPIATDVEWYATGAPAAISPGRSGEVGFEQDGVAHGVIELIDRPFVELSEAPARRWRRWGTALGPLDLPTVVAHTGLRAGFSFPDGQAADWVLTSSGWRRRASGRLVGSSARRRRVRPGDRRAVASTSGDPDDDQ